MSNLRIRVAYAIGKKLVEQGGDAKTLPVWSDISDAEQAILLELADAALAAIPSDEEGFGGLISEFDLRHVLDMHRDAADIVWGGDGSVSGLKFVEGITVADDDGENLRYYREGETYRRVPRVTAYVPSFIEA